MSMHYKFWGTAAALVLALSCSPPVGNNAVTPVKISHVGWVVENIDNSFWTSGGVAANLFYNFWIGYDGTLEAADLKDARVQIVGDGFWWVYNKTQGPTWTFQPSSHFIGGWYRQPYSSEGRILPLGNLKGVIDYADGTRVEAPLSLHEPGSSATPTHGWVVSEGQTELANASAYVQALPRPTGLSAVRTEPKITVTFTTGDSPIFNGYLWLFDATHHFLGSTPLFRDGQNGSLATWLNSGSGLVVNGVNTAEVTTGMLEPNTGISAADAFDAASEIIAVVTDGAQYVDGSGRYDHYDYRSISARVTIDTP